MKNNTYFFLKSLLISIACFTAGNLSHLLAIPPGFATPVWPAAGIALASVLLWGYSYLPAIFLGSFFTNLFIASDGGTVFLIKPILVGFFIAIGATLQALISSLLVKKFVVFPNRLEEEKTIFIIIFFGALIGCFVNATIGPLTLLSAGFINIESFLINSFIWWIGDAMGVILCAPVLLILFNVGVSNLRKIFVTIPILLFTTLAILIFFNEKEEIKFSAQNSFDNDANDIAIEFKRDIQAYTNILVSIESFINASNYVDNDEFTIFTSKFFDIYPSIKSLSWNPKITHDERAAFEEKIRQEGFVNFTIKDRLETGEFSIAAQRDLYYPITRLAPYDENQIALGYDVYGDDKVDNNVRRKTLDLAKENSEPIATERISLVQDKDKYGIIFYNPVYETHERTHRKELKQKYIIGYAAGIFIIPELLKPIKKLADQNNMHVILRDLSAGKNLEILYDSRTNDYKEPIVPILLNKDYLVSKIQFPSTGRLWELEFIQKGNPNIHNANWRLWYTLMGGLLLSGLFGAFLLVLSVNNEITISKEKKNKKIHYNYSIPIFSGFVTLAVLISLWSQLNKKNHDIILSLLNEEKFVITQSIETNIYHSITALQRMARRWEKQNRMTKADWIFDAKNYIDTEIGLTTIEWVDNTYHVRWIEPLIGNEAALGLNIIFDEKRSKALKGASQKGLVTITPPLDLVQGYRAFISYTPVYLNDNFDGFIVGIHNSTVFFDKIIPNHLKENFNIHITDGDEVLCSFVDNNKPFNDEWAVYESLELFNRDIKIAMWPKDKFVADHTSMLHEIMLLGIVLFSMLVGLAMYYATTARVNSKLLVKKTIDLEDQKKQSELARKEAEKANKLKSEFLASMSHELRTPMNGIIGTTELLMDGKLSKSQKNHLQNVILSAENLLGILNDILDFSKIEAGKMDLDYMSFDIKLATKDAIKLIDYRAKEKGLKIKFSYDKTLPNFVVCDPLRIRQIFYNLIGNAIKFTEHGYISVNILHDKNVKTNKNQVAIKVQIEDTGIGLTTKQQDIIFEKFMQADRSTTRKFGGTGLGLSICREFINMMGGEIGVTSEEGKGSIFWFTLVLDIGVKDKVAIKIKENKNERFDNMTILMAEDNRINSEFAKEMLKSFGITVLEARNGREAIQSFVENKSIDIILMDCHMPEVDGWQATQEIRKMEKENNLGHKTIIALTANAMKGDKEKCLSLGMDDYLSKPIRKNDLQKIISKWSLKINIDAKENK